MRQHGWRFPVFRDTNGLLSDAYGVHGLPTTVIIDSSGRIATSTASVQTVADLRAELEQAS